MWPQLQTESCIWSGVLNMANTMTSQSLCWIPRLGNLLWVLKLLQQCEHFFRIIVLRLRVVC